MDADTVCTYEDALQMQHLMAMLQVVADDLL